MVVEARGTVLNTSTRRLVYTSRSLANCAFRLRSGASRMSQCSMSVSTPA